MRFQLIDEEEPRHSISRMSRVLGVTAAGYHAWKTRPASARRVEEERLKDRIAFHFEQSHGTYGAPRIQDDLTDEGIHVSRKRVARLMRELDIAGVSGCEGKRRRRKSTLPETDAVKDLVRRDFTADGPDQVWFADISYVPTWEGWLLAQMRRPDAGLVHHSDRGAQYRSLAFGRCLRVSGILASMGETGVPHDNAVTESVMATIKKELVDRHRFKTRDEARFAIFRYIEGFYNPHRKHSSIGNLSPAEFERRLEERRLQAAAS
ncbi:MAG: IS3 family transposase [Actinomycetia bacterium]|nr:IS3 family transposase [Actinomycetes bacterium]